MNVGIIDYGAGNLKSVMFALKRIGVTARCGSRPKELEKCDRILFPGVGSARSAMIELRRRGFDTFLRSSEAPILGICLGLQLLFEYSEEEETECLGLLPGIVTKFGVARKVPHVGWNQITHLEGNLFRAVPEGSYQYFVHSYFLRDSHYASAQTEYEVRFASAVEFRNVSAVQFHPEKSGPVGEQILKNFIWRTS